MIDFTTPEAQAALAHAAEQSTLKAEDLAGWANVASVDDAQAILDLQDLANVPKTDVSTFDQIVAGIRLLADIAGLAPPILAVAPAVRAFIEAL